MQLICIALRNCSLWKYGFSGRSSQRFMITAT
jgi:hypothetical protein